MSCRQLVARWSPLWLRRISSSAARKNYSTAPRQRLFIPGRSLPSPVLPLADASGWMTSNGLRFFSDKDDDDKENNEAADSKKEEDLFGVHDNEDNENKLGATQPPLYKRDKATGRFTGEIVPELSPQERQALRATTSGDPVEADKLLVRRVQDHWKKKQETVEDELDKMGARVRETDMALNVLGRSVQAQSTEEELEDGTTLDEDKFSKPLTKAEFRSLSGYLKKKHHMEITGHDIPVHEREKKKPSSTTISSDEEDPDDVERSLKWLTSRAQRQMDDALDDNPYSDLMPGDLSPSRLVNRKRAKPIPTHLLHHNNIELLKYFMTPTGLIQNRVQTRLGARDQRRVARLVKRARCLGLIPHVGQFKAERHGWIHAKDIYKDREWEEDLVQRGLVISSTKQERQQEGGSDSTMSREPE